MKKDYVKIGNKLRKLAAFGEISQLGGPTDHVPVNLRLTLCEAYVIGYTMYIAYIWGKWSIEYTYDPAVCCRADMECIKNIKTDREMYAKVEEIIGEIRKRCGVR